MKKYTKSELVSHLRSLGIEPGDSVLVRASLQKVGRIEEPFKKTIMDALQEAVGEEGTLMCLGFTKSFFLGRGADKEENIFTKQTVPDTGGLAKLFFHHPQSERSTHPTNSYIAIGKNAKTLLDGHDENALSYKPIGKLIGLNGKLLLLGCLKDSPGFTTVHYVQEQLGLTKKSLISGLLKAYYYKDGQKKLFARKDLGGCSIGFRNFYPDYLEEDILKVGKVGDAPSLLINAKEAYDVEYKKVKANPKYFMCDNPLCFGCRASWRFSMASIPKYAVLKSIDMIKKRLG